MPVPQTRAPASFRRAPQTKPPAGEARDVPRRAAMVPPVPKNMLHALPPTRRQPPRRAPRSRPGCQSPDMPRRSPMVLPPRNHAHALPRTRARCLRGAPTETAPLAKARTCPGRAAIVRPLGTCRSPRTRAPAFVSARPQDDQGSIPPPAASPTAHSSAAVPEPNQRRAPTGRVHPLRSTTHRSTPSIPRDRPPPTNTRRVPPPTPGRELELVHPHSCPSSFLTAPEPAHQPSGPPGRQLGTWPGIACGT